MAFRGPQVVRVAGRSDAVAVAACVANAIYEGREIALRAIGAGAVNQAAKAAAIARRMVLEEQHDLICIPSMETVQMESHDGDGGMVERSAVVFTVMPRVAELVPH